MCLCCLAVTHLKIVMYQHLRHLTLLCVCVIVMWLKSWFAQHTSIILIYEQFSCVSSHLYSFSSENSYPFVACSFYWSIYCPKKCAKPYFSAFSRYFPIFLGSGSQCSVGNRNQLRAMFRSPVLATSLLRAEKSARISYLGCSFSE